MAATKMGRTGINATPAVAPMDWQMAKGDPARMAGPCIAAAKEPTSAKVK